MSTLHRLTERGLANPPSMAADQCPVRDDHGLGSRTEVSSDSSDMDVYGFAIPPQGRTCSPTFGARSSASGGPCLDSSNSRKHHIHDRDALWPVTGGLTT